MSHYNETENKIKRWLSEMGFTVSQTLQNEPEIEFNLRITNILGSGSLAVNIVKLRNKSIIMSGLIIRIDPAHREAFLKLNRVKKSNHIFEIQRDLLFLGVDFSFAPDIKDPEQIHINHPLFTEDLTKTTLITSLKAVRDAGLYVIAFYNNKFTTLVNR